MILIACVDSNGGMMFNGRRQSRDAVLSERILDVTKNGRLLMNGYSAKLFGSHPRIAETEDFLDAALDGEYVFVENADVSAYEDRIEKLILYCWNREYPFDVRFPLPLDGWKAVSEQEFKGKSHDRITEVVYERTDKQ